jgi:ABC-type phosphate transport system auxiliary subunit
MVEKLNSMFKELLKRRLILEEEIRNDVTVISDDFSALLSVLEKPRVQKDKKILRKSVVKQAQRRQTTHTNKEGVSPEVALIEKQLRELESKLNSI